MADSGASEATIYECCGGTVGEPHELSCRSVDMYEFAARAGIDLCRPSGSGDEQVQR